MSQASSKCKLKATLIRNEKEASKVAAIVEALERDRDRLKHKAEMLSVVTEGLGQGATEHYSTALLRRLLDPSWIDKVLAMPDEVIVARLKELADEGSLAAAAAAAAHMEELPAPLHFVALLMTLMLWAEPRFTAIHNRNLETGETSLPPQEAWSAIAGHLELSQQQLATLTTLSSSMAASMEPMYAAIEQAARDGLLVAAQQQQQQVLPQQQQARMHAESMLVRQQSLALLQIQVIGLQMGILAINTLSVRQMALLQSLSYPWCPRIDLVLSGLQQQQQQQQQQPQQQQQQQAV
ncbi:hypothetical protein OEZ85_002291 [Tetradesmus obliquus]|uniref:Uncharacterized protein n=1 Tax=Tetradesmus obliquus TaxID=3088 RepID=A0ABY8U371_TETOB|nr:hypothetical protein OEZ85_002291 [Tetradesmus obliquus]